MQDSKSISQHTRVENENLKKKAEDLFGSSVNITSEGQRHLGAAIGSESFKDAYCTEKVEKWKQELLNLCEIADTHPHMAYSAYVKGYKSKFTYCMRTIENFEKYLQPVEEVFSNLLISSLFGLESPLEDLRNVLSLNARWDWYLKPDRGSSDSTPSITSSDQTSCGIDN